MSLRKLQTVDFKGFFLKKHEVGLTVRLTFDPPSLEQAGGEIFVV
ncbi:MAG: hypothetical protein Q7J85_07170 [Bacillota bacterium]|nr:hypothetical protein [Bacillota bacterium]